MEGGGATPAAADTVVLDGGGGLAGPTTPPPSPLTWAAAVMVFWISRGERDNENLGGTREARPRACLGGASPLLFLYLLPSLLAGLVLGRSAGLRSVTGRRAPPPSCRTRGEQPRKEMEISLERHAEQTGGRPARPPGALPHTPLPPCPSAGAGGAPTCSGGFSLLPAPLLRAASGGNPLPPLTQPERGGCPRFLAPGVANVSRRQDRRRATTPCRRQPPPRASSHGRCSPFLFLFPPTSLLAIHPPPTPPPLPSAFFFCPLRPRDGPAAAAAHR